ncbi:hypothetical protein [Deferrisoma palaeochoriense]
MNPIDPCPEYADALTEAVWGGRADPAWEAHRAGCARCREAWARASGFAAEVHEAAPEVPASARNGLADAVFARTTRRARAVWAAWAWAGGALAAAGAAFLVLRRPGPPAVPGDEGIDFAKVDLELLESLDLAENLELLELLDALEALDDAG